MTTRHVVNLYFTINIRLLLYRLFRLMRYTDNKLMKGKALRKQSMHVKIAASVLLKLFISGNKNASPLTLLFYAKKEYK